jgi:SAM-dependent methyltransferase
LDASLTVVGRVEGRIPMNAGHMDFCLSETWKQMLEEQIIPEALRDVDLGDDVVEIGPGPGFTTDILRAQVGYVTAIEIDPVLARPLAERLAGTNVDVIEGDGSSLDLPDDRFSAAVCFNMLHHIPTSDTQDRVFAEMARVLRDEGVFLAIDDEENEGSRAFHEGDIYNPIGPDTLPSRLSTAGFTEVDVRRYELGWICTARV